MAMAGARKVRVVAWRRGRREPKRMCRMEEIPQEKRPA